MASADEFRICQVILEIGVAFYVKNMEISQTADLPMRRKFNSNIVVYLKDTYSFDPKVKVNKFTINFNSNCLFIEMFTRPDIRLGGRNTWSNGFNPLLSVVLYTARSFIKVSNQRLSS